MQKEVGFIFDKNHVVDCIVILFLSLFGGAARAALTSPREKSLGMIISSLIVAGFAGILSWQVLTYFDFPQQAQAAGAGIAGLLGDDLLRGIMSVAEKFRKDPLGTINDFRRGTKEEKDGRG